MPDSSEQLSTGVNFGGTNPVEQPKLGVYAPLDVQGAKSQASLLAQSLGVVDDRLQRPIMYAERAEGEDQAKQQAANGEVAANNGTVDASNPYVAYQRAAKSVSVQRSMLQATSQAQDFLSKPSSAGGWSDLPLHDQQNSDGSTSPGLMSTLDNFMKSKLGGLESDPEAAPVLAPMLTHFYSEALGAVQQKQRQDTVNTAVQNIQALALHSFKLNDKSFTWDQGFSQLVDLGVDKTTASKLMVHAVGEASVQAGDPTLIDRYLPQSTKLADGQTIAGPGDVPENGQYLQDARTRALSEAAKNNKASLNAQGASLVSQAINKQDITGGLLQYLKTPGADFKDAMSMYDFQQKLIKQQQDAVVDPGVAADVTRQIALRQIETPQQLVAFVTNTHLDAKAQAQILDKGLSDMKSIDTLSTDDPQMKAMQANLQQIYQPTTDVLGKFNHPAARTQQSGVLLDFRTEYQGALKKGVTPELAAQQAHDIVVKKWGDPLEISNKYGQQMPLTDVDRATVVRGRDISKIRAAGLKSQDIGHLHDLGLVSDDDAANFYKANIALHQH